MATNQQDVRVKLSAEGMAEVVAAFQKVASEGKKSGQETANAFKQLNEQMREIGKNLLGGLGLVYAVDKFKDFFKGALEGAEALSRLSRQTGLTTDAIQAMQRAARETGISSEAANAGLEKFTVAVGKAEIGSKQTGTALADLGISVKSLKDLSPDQQLQAVAERLASIQDPARRARDEVALFGRAGIELDQALVKMGEEGIGGFVKHLKELGIYLDAQTIAQLKGAKEAMRDVGDQVKGLATQFLAGLVPSLRDVADQFTNATHGGEGFRKVGQIVGDLLRGLAGAFQEVGIWIGATVVRVQLLFEGLGEAAVKLAHGKWHEATQSMKESLSEIRAVTQQMSADIAAVEAKYKAGPEKLPEEKPGAAAGSVAGGVTQQDQALAQAHYQFVVAQLDNELKLYQAHQKLLLDQEKGAYDRGEISLKEYYARRAAIISAEYDKQIDIAKRKLAAEQAIPIAASDTGVVAEQHRAEAEKLKGEIADLNAQRQVALQQDTNALAQEELRIADATVRAQEQLLTLEGKKAEAARLRLQLEAQALDKQLAAGGVSASDRSAAMSGFTAGGEAKIGFDDAAQDAKTALQQLDTAKKQIQDRVRDGLIFSIAGEQQILELDRQQLPILQEKAKAMADFAAKSGDPQLVAQAAAFGEKVNEIGVATNIAGQRMAEFRAGVENAFQSGLSTFLKDALSGTKSLSDSFRAAALSIVQGLEQIAEKALEQEILQHIFGMGSGGGGAGSWVGAIASAFGGGFAGGGLIRGPGTSTSDSIPAMLSDNEFVINAAAVKQPGVLPLLQAINGGKLKPAGGTAVPRYASGGLVSGAAAAPVVKLVNVLDPTTLGDHLSTKAGETAVLNVIARNPGKVRNSLG